MTDPATDKPALRRRLQAERLALPDRAARSRRLEAVLEAWLGAREARTIGAYWPIRGEFDPWPVLRRWRETVAGRRLGLPVVEVGPRRMRFHEWLPDGVMAEDAYGIPEPQGTGAVEPELLLAPCVGFGPGGVRLGYGGGYYDRMLAALDPAPATAGIAFAHGFVPGLEPGPFDIALDTILTEDGVAFDRSR